MSNPHNQNISTLLGPIGQDEEWYAGKRRKIKDNFPFPFTIIKGLTTVHTYSETNKDIVDIMTFLPKGARELFRSMKLIRDYNNNLVNYVHQNDTESLKVTFSRNLSKIIKADLVKKIPKKFMEQGNNCFNYILNPNIIKCVNYEESVEFWEKI